MRVTSKVNGLMIAAAAAALFATAPLSGCAAEGEKTGHCMGANACKGQSDCKTANNACTGQNACKGQGFKATTPKECAELGGKFEAVEAEQGKTEG